MLLIDTTPLAVVQIAVTSFIGIFGVAAALEGYCFAHMNPVMRIVIAAGGLLLIIPGAVSDLLGLAIVVGCVMIQRGIAGRQKKAAA